MSFLSNAQPVARASFLNKLSNYIVIFAIIVILINCGIIYFKTNDIKQSVGYIGDRLIYNTLNLEKEANQIIDNKITTSQGPMKYLEYIWFGLIVFNDFSILYIWFIILNWIIRKLVLFSDDMTSIAFLLSIFFYFAIQMIVLFMKGESVAIPFMAFYDIARAIVYIAGGPVSNVVDWAVPGSNSNISNINTSISNMNTSSLQKLNNLTNLIK